MYRLAAIVSFAVATALFGATSASAATDPPQSIPPTAAFAQACYGQPKPTKACATQAIANINTARAMEGLGAIVLPSNYSSLAFKQKAVAVSNAERTSRGLAALPESAAYDKLAKRGAKANDDPIGPPGHGWGSIWAGGVADPLAANYLWMYYDGPGGVNLDCQHTGDPGCWGHRHVILGAPWTAIGVGHKGDSIAELFVQ